VHGSVGPAMAGRRTGGVSLLQGASADRPGGFSKSGAGPEQREGEAWDAAGAPLLTGPI